MRVCEEIKNEFVAQNLFYLLIHLFNTRHANQ